MEIAIYVGRDFANENSKIFKPVKIHHKSNTKDMDNLAEFDKGKSTTLSELYSDGWVLNTVSYPFNNIVMLFMEKS